MRKDDSPAPDCVDVTVWYDVGVHLPAYMHIVSTKRRHDLDQSIPFISLCYSMTDE